MAQTIKNRDEQQKFEDHIEFFERTKESNITQNKSLEEEQQNFAKEI